MSMPYRLIAVDIDGTLMNTRNELPEANRAALHRAHEAGLTVCLCTGRTWTESRTVAEAVGVDSDAGVFVFGAIVTRLPEGETVHRAALERSVVDRIVAHFEDRGYPILVLYDPTQTGFDYRMLRGEKNLAIYEKWMELSPTHCEQIDTWNPIEHDPVRITIVDTPDCIDRTMHEVQEAFPAEEVKCNRIYAPNYQLHVVECFAPHVNKWHGLMQVARARGIEGRQIAAIGDDVNDLEMIERAGLGIAMGNAVEPVKRIAQRQAPTNNEAGVASAIEAILDGRW